MRSGAQSLLARLIAQRSPQPLAAGRHRPGDRRHRAVRVAAGPQNLVMQDELMLILDHAHRHSQLLRHPRLALGHPPGVRLKDREHFFRMRDILAPEHPPLDLNPRLLGKIPRRLSFGPLRLALVQTGAHPVRRLSRPPGVAHPIERLPDISDHMAMLAPRRQPQIIAQRIASHSRFWAVGKWSLVSTPKLSVSARPRTVSPGFFFGNIYVSAEKKSGAADPDLRYIS